jgi:hypothetical protein
LADGRRSVCRTCKARRTRELAAARDADEEPAPAPTPRDPNNLVASSHAELVDRDQRRELLAELRANGVETEQRDGREYGDRGDPPPRLYVARPPSRTAGCTYRGLGRGAS